MIINRNFLIAALCVYTALQTTSCSLDTPDPEWRLCTNAIDAGQPVTSYFDLDYHNPPKADSDIEKYVESKCRTESFKGCFAIPGKREFACSPCKEEWQLQCLSGGKCIDVKDNPEHCGSCNHACYSNEKCTNGQCICSENACKDDNTLLKCQKDGTTSEETCPYGCENGACKPLPPCRDNEIHDGLECKCDEANNWTGDADNCTCKAGYYEKNGACVRDKSCDGSANLIFDDDKDSCVCNADKNWVPDKDGNCICNDGYLDIDNECQPKTSCTQPNTILQESDNTCICDKDNGWTGKAGSCECKSNGFFPIGDKCKSFKDISIGTKLHFGTYQQEKGKEPIEWRVLDISENKDKMLLISVKALDVKAYHDIAEDIVWAKCSLRSWLNGYDASENKLGNDYTDKNFLDTAFTQAEKGRIVANTIKTPNNNGISGGATTIDQVFLLSKDEAEKYFVSDEDRKTEGTKYVLETKRADALDQTGKAYTPTSPNGCSAEHCYIWWWLRSPGNLANQAARVVYDGSISTSPTNDKVNYANASVRPAIWIK